MQKTAKINHINDKKILLVFLCLFFYGNFSIFAQSEGDYRSFTSGNWATSSTWQVYDGSIWTSTSSYPGQSSGTYSINIQAGHNVSIPNTGISTSQMGNLTINGTLTLNGGNTGIVSYSLNTSQIYITPNLSPRANIYFNNKSSLVLPQDAIIKVWLYGLQGSCNNNQEIKIGGNTFAVCNGAPGNIFTFDELMAGGGTINSIITPSAINICLGDSINLTGSYSGAVDQTPTYFWSSSGVATLVFNPSTSSQNTKIKPLLEGAYEIFLSCTTYNEGTAYTNTERVSIFVNKKSSNPTSAVAGTNQLMLGTSTTLSLQGGGGGNNETIRWFTSSCNGTFIGEGNNLVVSPTTETTYYGRYENASPCSYVSSCAQTTIQIIPFYNIWKGSISTDFAVAGNWLNNTIPLNGQDIVFDNNPLNDCILDSSRSFRNISNSSTKSFIVSNHTLTISGELDFSGVGRIDASNASSKLLFNGSSTQDINSNTFKGDTINSLEVNNVFGIFLNSSIIITTDLILTKGDFLISSNTLTINGLINNIEGNLIGGNLSCLIIGGESSRANLKSITLKDLTLNRENGLLLSGAIQIKNNFNLVNGILSIGSNTLTISGNSPSRNQGKIDASTISATIVFANSNPIVLPDSIFNGLIYSIIIDGLGGVTLSEDLSISHSLEFIKGIIHTDTNKLIFSNSSTGVLGASHENYIDGNCAKIGNTAFTFPIGNNGRYAPIAISDAHGESSSTDLFIAYYRYSLPHELYDSSLYGSDIIRISSIEYWMLNRIGTNNVEVTLSFDSNSGVTETEHLIVAHWNGSFWENAGKSSICCNKSIGSITSNLVSNFSPFTLGSTIKNQNPLPIKLLSFNVECADKNTIVTWETATEQNNHYFTIERSTDGIVFNECSRVFGAGNSNSITNYSYIDSLKPEGIVYYRLKQTDFDGKEVVFKPQSLNCEEPPEAIMLQLNPNPFNDVLTVQSSTPFNGLIQLFDLTGNMLYQEKTLINGAYQLDLSSCKAGLYVLKITQDCGKIHVFKAIKKY